MSRVPSGSVATAPWANGGRCRGASVVHQPDALSQLSCATRPSVTTTLRRESSVRQNLGPLSTINPKRRKRDTTNAQRDGSTRAAEGNGRTTQSHDGRWREKRAWTRLVGVFPR